ncbi:MAG: glycosyltransferase family 2 protein [Pyrinomonadaceae bacterium]
MEISVITPVYNGERFIECCLNSVIEQACPYVEHLIMDGGSTDRTTEIVERYAAKHPHLRLISENDAGQSDAMNKGIALAQGVILGFLNVDDFYEPNVLNRVYEIFQELPEPSLLAGNCKVIDENGNLLWLNKPDTKYYQLLQVWRYKMPNNPSAYFYHRSLHDKIGGYDVEEHYTLDYDFLLRAFQKANVVYIDETLGNFRFYAGTKTSESVAQGTQWDMICRLSMKYAAQKGLFYRLYLHLSIAQLRANLKEVENPSRISKAKWILRRDGITLLDKVARALEKNGGR